MSNGMLEGKIALITGAGSGIGRASALKFIKEGAKVIIVDYNAEGGEETLQMIKKAGGEGIFVKADISRKDDVEAMVKKAVETYGQLDCAHNNAGVGGSGGFLTDVSEEEWDRIININLKGVWFCLRAEIRQMLKQHGGAIVNTASVLGLTGAKYCSSYIASKHGVIGLTRAAALECVTRGIRINCVCPGVVKTAMLGPMVADKNRAALMASMQPPNRLAEPEEIANAAVWLCSSEASFINGHALSADGGMNVEVMKLPSEITGIVP